MGVVESLFTALGTTPSLGGPSMGWFVNDFQRDMQLPSLQFTNHNHCVSTEL